MPLAVPLTVTEPSGVARSGEGVRSGVPFAKGQLRGLAGLALRDDAERAVPAQFESLSRWEDGSQRWVLVIFRDTLAAGATKRYTLTVPDPTPSSRAPGVAASAATSPAPSAESVRITSAEDTFTVDTGRVRFDVPIYGHRMLANIQRRSSAGDWVSVSQRGLEAVIWRTGVNPFKSHVENCVVESAGPLAAVVKIEGHYLLWDPDTDNFDPSELPTFAFILRVFVYAGSDELRLQYTFLNDNRDHRRRASERYHVYAMEELADWKWVNGRWVERPKGLKFRERELLEDDYGQVNVKSIKLRLWLDGEHTSYRFGVEGGEPWSGPIDGPVALEQVGPVAVYESFYKEMPYPHQPFKAMLVRGKGKALAEAEKAAGWVVMEAASKDASPSNAHGFHAVGSSVCFASKYFWQYHPKIYALDKDKLEFHVWSKLGTDLPDPEIGFAKTHEVMLRFGLPGETLDPAAMTAGLHRPLRAAAAPEQYVGSGVFGTFSPADRAAFGDAEGYFLTSTLNAEKNREEGNLYGVRNYGDTAGIRFLTPVWWNQEYDIMLGAMVQFARTGERAYLDEADVLAWHFLDVDVLHASNSPLDEGGQHMHFTDHAKGETHAGHGTCEGLWHYHMLTGEPRAREVAEGIGNFFAKIAAWKDFLDFRDDEERTLGWALKALVSSYRATLNPRFKLAAQMVVEQALAGQDPDTGNWDHPLYPNEDKCRPTCIGGKPWMVGIVLQGMKEYHRAFGDERVAAAILKAADWMIWSQYVYMTAKGQEAGKGYYHHLDGLSYAWELSGKRHYLDEALAIFAHSLAGMKPEHASRGTLSGSHTEAIANMMRLTAGLDRDRWCEGGCVRDEETTRLITTMRADPRYVAKPQKRY